MKTLKLAIATIALVLGFQAANAQVSVGIHIGTPPPRQVVVVNRPVVVHRAPVVYERPVVVRHRPVIVHRGPARYRQVVHYRHGNRYYVNQPCYVAYRR
ncbi:hypothetical protein [Mucilaginibacter auburnensis]|uniref:PXPV repeat-containing protein n=1 Tax=Mucilaginibacter auburnensis TaxID=1457233 RepID=A0A2H9VUV4_9SPHI|nr:hypothetical protein [Mucilaginibacter auburnensis]PJJ84604.1 hypothetical protein CLV57_1618 [Mucilaginibacter auburnensis]